MGEKVEDRIEMLGGQLENVPIKMLILTSGSELANAEPVSPLDFVRTIARLPMPPRVAPK
ncbi:hypothetical protein [Mesorhizobium sangaii]|uniref:Biotin synthase-like enzyme n=1 Tax=Mesorhizobium sangaii TaxID=505389 RepID=A0A841PF48_9HYPH|nr:biotin synthase-like enzyme [Mesorhizobium sangaii]